MRNLSNSTNRKQLGINVFDDSQCEAIHQAVLEVIEDVGVEVHNEKALEILKKAGAYIDGTRARIPAGLVEKAIRSAPSNVKIYSRDGKTKMVLGGHRFYYGPGPTVVYMLDSFTGERRVPGYEDISQAIKVMDSLENFDYAMDFATIDGVEVDIIDVRSFKALLENTSKPIVHWSYNKDNTKAMIDMAAKAKGGLQELQKHPFFAIYAEPITPLVHENEGLDVAMTMAEYGLPLVYTSAAQGGLTSPATLAGTLVVQLAESLTGLVVCQSIREGTPFIMGGVPTVVDMSTMAMTYASPEFNLLNLATSSMSKYYGLPVFTTGGCSDSKCVDQQAGIDMSTSILLTALSGGNLIHDVGYMEGGMSNSMTQLVIANEVIGQTKRIIRGIEVSDETLALDVIKSVGPGGNYIGEQHTFDNFKKEWFLPELFNRQVNPNWVADGSPTLADLANRKLEKILAEHQPNGIDKDVSKECDYIIEELLKKY